MINIEKKLNLLAAQKTKWRALPDTQKIDYLEKCMSQLMKVKEEWVQRSVQNKKIDTNSPTVGQEWITGPAIVMRGLRMLKFSLHHNASPPIKKITTNRMGQSVAQVLPANFYESILFYKTTAEIVIQKNEKPTQGQNYKALRDQKGSLCLVLGAGNVSSVPAIDVLDKLFSHANVCVLKFNPVNEYLYEVFETVFKPLIDDGFLALVKGDKQTGEFLCAHELIDEIHVTGSYQTYQALLKYNKKVTAELGCVTPAMIVPGKWTKSDLIFQAKQIASGVENNASFNCNAIKVLILSKNWEQKDVFLNLLKDEFKKVPPRYAYYPGAQERYNEFLKHYPNCEVLGKRVHTTDSSVNLNASVPWTLIPNVQVKPGEYALNQEAFCGVLAVVELDETAGSDSLSPRGSTTGAMDFLSQAVNVCNDSIWGTLSCALIVDPKTHKKFNTEIENAILNLKYGSIGVNCWAALSFGLYATTWGGFPEPGGEGSCSKVAASGVGFVNNGYFFDHPEKSIIRAPFHPPLKPVWFYDNKNLVNIGKNFVNFEYSQSFLDFMKLVGSALRG